MANFIGNVKLPDDTTYQFHDSEFIQDTRTSATYPFTGVSHATELFDGMQITYMTNYTYGSGDATLRLTLADGSVTSDLPVYYQGTTRLSNQYVAGTVYRMVYRSNPVIAGTARGAGWWIDAERDTESGQAKYAQYLQSYTNGFKQYSLVMENGEHPGYWESLVTSNGTDTSKQCYTGGLVPGKVIYFLNSNNYTATQTQSGNYSTFYDAYAYIDLRYTLNITTSTFSLKQPIFLVGKIHGDGLFYLNDGVASTTGWWYEGIPTVVDDNDYIFIGYTYNKYPIGLTVENPTYRFINGQFTQLDVEKIYYNQKVVDGVLYIQGL